MTDEEIVEMYLSRNPTALNVTAEKYGGFLYAISMNVIHSRADAEECVTDAYLACWNTIPPEKPRSLKAYAGALCRNISFDRYKRAHAQKRGGGKVETLLSEVEEFLPAEGFGSDYGEDKADCFRAEILVFRHRQRHCRADGIFRKQGEVPSVSPAQKTQRKIG